MKNKITLLIVIGCIVFCATDVIQGSADFVEVNETIGDNVTNSDESTGGWVAQGVDSADADGDWEDADGNLHSAAGEILFADGTFQDKNGNMYDAEGNKMTTSDSLTASAEATSGKPATQTATLDLAEGDNSPTKNGSSTSAANVAKVPQTFTLDLSGGSAGEESTTSAANDLSESAGEDSTTTNDQAKPLTFAEIQANLVAQYEQFLPEGKTWSTATESEKTLAILESNLTEGETLETASTEEIAQAGVETMAKEAAANTTSANPALDAFFKLSQNILDWFDTVFGKITEIFNNFDSIFNGTKTTTNEINVQIFKAQLLAERNAAPDLSPARMSDIQTSVDASSNEANNINAAKKVLGITNSEFTAEDVENAYSDTSLKKAAVNQILDGTQSINIATNIKNAYKVLLNNIPTANLNL